MDDGLFFCGFEAANQELAEPMIARCADSAPVRADAVAAQQTRIYVAPLLRVHALKMLRWLMPAPTGPPIAQGVF